jgi:hypothetical protein
MPVSIIAVLRMPAVMRQPLLCSAASHVILFILFI